MESKSFALTEVKAVDGGTAGEFEAVVSVFGNVDSYGDRMMKGAFARTLSEKGMPPVVWSHEWSTAPIGMTTSAIETDEGLLIKGRLFVDPSEDHAVARQVYTAMKAGALREFSFGYSTKSSNDVTENGETVREITDVDLYEVGPTLVGANAQTRLVAIKSLERDVLAKAGRVLSKSNEGRLREASQIIDEVLAQVASEPEKSAPVTHNVTVNVPAGTAPDPKALSHGISLASDIYTSASTTYSPEFHLTPTSDVKSADQKPADKPDPKDTAPAMSEEDRVRTVRLRLARPIHI